MITMANSNVLLCDHCPNVGELMDARVRDVFDFNCKHPELEDGVRLVGIGYSSPARRPDHPQLTLLQAMLMASNDYKVAVLL